jgi:hypothetical protein
MITEMLSGISQSQDGYTRLPIFELYLKNGAVNTESALGHREGQSATDLRTR